MCYTTETPCILVFFYVVHAPAYKIPNANKNLYRLICFLISYYEQLLLGYSDTFCKC